MGTFPRSRVGLGLVVAAALGLLVSGCQFQAETPSGDVVQVDVSQQSLQQFFRRSDELSDQMLSELTSLGNHGLARVMVEFRDVLSDLRTMNGTIKVDKANTLQRKLSAFEYQLSHDVTTPTLARRYERVQTLLRHLKKEMRRLEAFLDRTGAQ